VEFRVASCKAWITSDRNLLRRILQNLIGNAFRYASPGKILLGARIVGKHVNIQVVDNGPGIPLEKQKIVFEQFTQLENSTSHTSRGLGLGLNITQSLAQLLEHPLSLKSKEQQGCKFSLAIPKAQRQFKINIEQPIAKIGLKDVTVMCIDNDPDVLNGMTELLSAWQCNVLSANSFEQAKEIFLLHENEVEILLVDYQLNNNQNGLTLIKTLRANSNHYIPAILITATTNSDIEEKTQKANVGFMRKLVKPATLRAMMSAMLAKKLQDNYAE
ncbi:MAG: CheY-like chemotaxis protein/anti-sigma regulatory factor (Ser/Thr protein kinase), partial [Colwellia sp.]